MARRLDKRRLISCFHSGSSPPTGFLNGMHQIGPFSGSLASRLCCLLTSGAADWREESIPIDVRLIYATNRDLKDMVARGLFREDLYFRINVAHVHIPPLRERKEDIAWLAHRVIEDFFRRQGKRRLLLPVTERYLEQQPWHGNLRELANTVERACILANQEVLGIRELASVEEGGGKAEQQLQLKEAMDRYEKSLLEETLELHEWRIMETALSLGISRKSLWEKMRRHNIKPPK